MPPAAALIYALVMLRRLPEIVDQLTWNADYVSVMVMAQSVGTSGKSGRAVIIQIGWYWFNLATEHLPFHRQVWEYAPFVLAMAALALRSSQETSLIGPTYCRLEKALYGATRNQARKPRGKSAQSTMP